MSRSRHTKICKLKKFTGVRNVDSYVGVRTVVHLVILQKPVIKVMAIKLLPTPILSRVVPPYTTNQFKLVMSERGTSPINITFILLVVYIMFL